MPRMPNIYLEAQYQQRLWTPAVLRPDFWFDASDASTVTTVSGNVSEWRDKSGNGRNLSEAINRPAYSIENRNGLNAISFSSASQQNLAATGLSLTYTSQSNFIVSRPNSPELNARLWSQSDASTDFGTASHYIPFFFEPSVLSIHTFLNGGNRSSLSYVNSAWTQIASIINGTQLVNYQNGTAASAYVHSWPGKTFTRFGVSQAFSGASQKLIADVGEIVVLNYDASLRDRQLVEGYLSWKWGIRLAADHPYVNRPPLIGD